MLNQFLSDLRQVLPSDRIYTDELRTLGWGTDASFYRQIPKVVVRSDGEAEISKIVQLCRKYKMPFTFRAAGTSLSGQSCTDSVLIVAGKHWEKYKIISNEELGIRNYDYYTLDGRKLNGKPTQKGLYIVNGRKFVIK